MSTLVGLVVCLIASTTLLTNQGLRSWQLGRLERLQASGSPGLLERAEVAEGLP
jgi:hypothetical protein